jgi:hypothetical protein
MMSNHGHEGASDKAPEQPYAHKPPKTIPKAHAMKTITLLTLIAILLSSTLDKSSVGGPLTDMLIVFIAMLAVGIHEARSKERGALGWIVSIVASLVGGCVGLYLHSVAMGIILSLIQFQGRVIDHPVVLFTSSATAAILTVLGSWVALKIVNRFR